MYKPNKRKELVEALVALIKRTTIVGTETCYQVGTNVELQLTANGITISIDDLFVDEISKDYNIPIHNALYESRMKTIDNFLKDTI